MHKITWHDIVDKVRKDPHSLVFISLSSPRKVSDILRMRIKPVLLKGVCQFQVEAFTEKQSFTKNIGLSDLEKEVIARSHEFSQSIVRFRGSELHLRMNTEGITSFKTKLVQAEVSLQHNRRKKYLLPEDEPIDFLIALGIQNKQGKVLREKYDKFRQINQFIQLLTPLFEALEGPLCVVDLACGKAYLTFALYYYLSVKLGHVVTLYGVDVKEEVLKKCQELANHLGYSGMHFVPSTIADFTLQKKVDFVVALHACDTATDEAINKALSLHAKAMAIAPCCQHELASQLKKNCLPLLLKHGYLKERFAALATDALRAEFLEQNGYKTDLVEFVDPEHTPKNLLIRAVKRARPQKADWSSYLDLSKELGVDLKKLVIL